MPQPRTSRNDQEPLPQPTVITRLGRKVRAICDPVTQVCHPILAGHYDAKYRSRFPRHHGKMLLLDLILVTLLAAALLAWIWISLGTPSVRFDTVTLESSAPAVVSQGSETAVSFAYRNDSRAPAANAELTVRIPQGFRVTSVAPSPNERSSDSLRFSLGRLRAGAEGAILIKGRADAPGSLVFHGSLASWEEGKAASSAATSSIAITIDGRLPATADANGISAEPVVPDLSVVRPGDTVKVGVRYRNDGTRPALNANIALVVEGPFPEPYQTRTVSWDAGSIPELRHIAAGASGTVTAEMQIGRFDPDAAPSVEPPSLSLASEAAYEIEGERFAVPPSPSLAVPLTADIGLSAYGRYFLPADEQVGLGPLPPVVGEPTVYRMFLIPSAVGGKLRDAAIEATLPENVDWHGDASATGGENVDYIPSLRLVRWKLGELSPRLEASDIYLGASFEVQLTPTVGDIGTEPVLLGGIVLRGTDLATGEPVAAFAPAVTAGLLGDPRAEGQGTVQR